MRLISLLLVFFLVYCIGHSLIHHDKVELTTEPKTVLISGGKVFHVWEFRGERMHPFGLWKTVQVVVKFLGNAGDSECIIYQNSNKSEVVKAHEENQRFLSNLFRRWSVTGQPSSYIHPFESTYVGIEADQSYSVCLKYKNVDYMLALLFLSGVVLFFTAKQLSRSAAAFYAGSTAIGVAGSLLIVIFLVYRLAPKRSVAVSVLLGGWSFVAYITFAMWMNLYSILVNYYRYVAIYFVSVAVISLALSYRAGPPKDIRTLNLIRWGLQAFGLGMIYTGCQIPAMSIATIIALVLVAILPRWFGRPFMWIRYRMFPPKRRLLSEEEYIDEGVKETRRALEGLRKYCQSPNCNSWRTVSRLQSPGQFAEFVNGKRSHISDEEILLYSNESEVSGRDSENEDDSVSENSIEFLEENGTGRDRGNQSFSSYQLRSTPRTSTGRYFESYYSGHLPSSAPERLTQRTNVSQYRAFNGF